MAVPKFIFKTISGQKLRPSGTYYSTILERIPDEGIKPIDIHPEFEDRIPRSYDDYYDEFGIDIDD